MSFKVLSKSTECKARHGSFELSHGIVNTPQFMPVGTQGTVKGLEPHELKEMGAEIILGNTYHLWLRPGEDIVQEAGGLHEFESWDAPILTDSGGFQVFSLAKIRKLTDEGVTFSSHIDGSRLFLSPEKSMEIQAALHSDIAMQLDECAPYPAERKYLEESMRLSIDWYERCLAVHHTEGQILLPIIQGGMEADLRRESASRLAEFDPPGFGIGGLSVGEPAELMYQMIEVVVPELPEDKPRYLMGVGAPEQLLEAVSRGVDLFDCVLPTRLGRHGQIFTRKGKVTIRNLQYARDFSPLDSSCDCRMCKTYSRAYVRHLIKANELLAMKICSYHNVYFLLKLMAGARTAIEEDCFLEYKNDFLRSYLTL